MATKPPTATNPEKIGRVGQRRQVVIPLDIFDALNLSVGDFVAITRHENSVVIKPKRLVDRDADALTPEQAKLVRRGEAQFKRGDSKPWRDIKHALAR